MIETARFRELLFSQHISQAELARRVGISQQAIARIATGASNSSRYLHKIARELQTTPEYLLGESDDRCEDSEHGSLSGEELTVISLFRQMDQADRSAVMHILTTMAGRSTMHSPTRSFQTQQQF